VVSAIYRQVFESTMRRYGAGARLSVVVPVHRGQGVCV
jgi:hypothetical protein